MKLFIVLVAIISVPGSDLDCPYATRIIAGRDARVGAFPYMVFLEVRHHVGDPTGCGGALISPIWVLTVGHCVNGAKSIRMRFGGINHIRNPEPGTTVRTSKTFIQHPAYDRSPTEYNDIALVKLRKPVKESFRIEPIRLPRRYPNDASNNTLTVSGWGKMQNGRLARILQYTDVTIYEDSKCTPHYLEFVPKLNLCSKECGSNAFCHGDSGGPLIDVEWDAVDTLIGLVSYGAKNYTCTTTIPQVYTRVSGYLDWIHQQTNITIRS